MLSHHFNIMVDLWNHDDSNRSYCDFYWSVLTNHDFILSMSLYSSMVESSGWSMIYAETNCVWKS